MFANHRTPGAELFLAAKAKIATATGDEVMKTDPVAWLEAGHLVTDALDDAGNLVAQSEREREGRGPSGAVMGIGMADAGRFHADQGVRRAEGGHGHFLQAEWAAGLEQTDGFHCPVLTQKFLLSIATRGGKLKQLR
jgi:hypothetical protein